MRVYIHGNCQAYVLGEMLREVHPAWDITAFEVHSAKIIDQIEDYYRAVRISDVVITQAIREEYRGRRDLGVAWVKDNVKPGAQVITVSAMHFEGHHLGGSHLGAFGPLGNDVMAAHMIGAGVAPDKAVDLLLSPDLIESSFIRTEIEISVEEVRRRDSELGIEIPFSPLAPHFAGDKQLLHLTNHPCRPLYAWLANAVLDYMDICGPRVAYDGKDYQGVPHFPAYPCVLANAPTAEPFLDWSGEQSSVARFQGMPPMGQREFTERIVAHLAANPIAEVNAALRNSWQSARFLRRLARAESNVPGLDVWREC